MSAARLDISAEHRGRDGGPGEYEVRGKSKASCYCLCSPIAGELSAEKLWFDVPVHCTYLFTTSQWHFHPAYYVLYKVCVSIFLCSWLVMSGQRAAGTGGKWFVYLTNLTYLTLTSYNVYSTVLAVSWYATHMDLSVHEEHTAGLKDSPGERQVEANMEGSRGSPPSPPSISWPYRLCWLLASTSWVGSLGVTCAYWLLLYPLAPDEPVNAVSFHTHALNSVLVLLDLLISALPVRLLHVWTCQLYALLYLLFSALYWAAGGTDNKGRSWIYPVLDWGERPWLAVAVSAVALLLAVPLLQLLAYSLYRARVRLYTCVEKRAPPTLDRKARADSYDSFV